MQIHIHELRENIYGKLKMNWVTQLRASIKNVPPETHYNYLHFGVHSEKMLCLPNRPKCHNILFVINCVFIHRIFSNIYGPFFIILIDLP